MNKYEKQYNKIEKKSILKSNIQSAILDIKVLTKWNKESSNKLPFRRNLFQKMIFYLVGAPDEFVEWIKKEVFPNINTVHLIRNFLMELCYLNYEENEELRKTLMNSMKRADLVKDINYDDNEKVYIVITKEGKKYIVDSAEKNNKDIAEDCNGRCHSCTEAALKEVTEIANDEFDFYGCCVLYHDLFNNPRYHSYIVRDDIVFDFAYNIVSTEDLYINEFGYEILLKEEASKVLAKIEDLKATDNDFNKSKKYGILKYAMSNHMKRKH